MGFCIPLIGGLTKFYVGVFTFFLKFFVPLEGISLTLAGLIISSVLIFIFAKMLGKTGGLLLIVLGIAGAAFSAGITLVISAIGAVLTFYGRSANLIVMINTILFVLAIICSI